jgi:CMP-N-acetylneuraminic acid synthetase
MINGKGVIAIIPARSGSKRLPQKNILGLSGKPLIAWTIEAALNSGLFDKIIVSTDSNHIAEISTRYGAEAPFLRPSCLSSDTATSFDVVVHALDYFSKIGEVFDTVTLLQPTSPLRTAEHIKKAFKLYNKKNASSVISVCECEHSPLWSNIVEEDLSLENFLEPGLLLKRSQDLPAYYRLNGAIYVCKSKALIDNRSFFTPKGAYAYKMDTSSSIDIDNLIDFQLAQVVMTQKALDIKC